MESVALTEKLFCGPCDFVRPITKLEDLEDWAIPEIAFAGRSNVGKSSLINALFNNKSIAKTSNTPGRTQALNFFLVGNAFHFVDMPGYGYAKAPKALVNSWNELIIQYLKGRRVLKRVYLLIDARHGVKPNDQEVMDLLNTAAMSYQIIVTKTDKVSPAEVQKVLAKIEDLFPKNPALYPILLSSSAVKRTGLEEIQQAILETLRLG